MIKYRKLGPDSYVCTEGYAYYSARYDKYITIHEGYRSDGATGALDRCPTAWFIHDKLCETGCWNDSTPISAWQAAKVLSDILKQYGHWFRARTWFVATFLFGCNRAKDNGWFKAS